MSEHEKIYLIKVDDEDLGEFAWCQDRINEDDIEYVLASEYDSLKAQNMQMYAILKQLSYEIDPGDDYHYDNEIISLLAQIEGEK